MAKAVDVFNRMPSSDVASKASGQARAAQARKTDMHNLAKSFDVAVGDIIETASSSANQLETSASTLSHTVETAQKLSTAVAGRLGARPMSSTGKCRARASRPITMSPRLGRSS